MSPRRLPACKQSAYPIGGFVSKSGPIRNQPRSLDRGLANDVRARRDEAAIKAPKKDRLMAELQETIDMQIEMVVQSTRHRH